MRLDELPWEDQNEYWDQAFFSSPSGERYRIARRKDYDTEDGCGYRAGSYFVAEMKFGGGDALTARWRYLDDLAAQCIVYELLKNNNPGGNDER